MSYMPTRGEKIQILDTEGIEAKFDEDHKLHALACGRWVRVDGMDRGQLEGLMSEHAEYRPKTTP